MVCTSPLFQCSECHTTGWLSRLAPASRKLSNRLDEIYNTWFSGAVRAVRLYAGEDGPGHTSKDATARVLRLRQSAAQYGRLPGLWP